MPSGPPGFPSVSPLPTPTWHGLSLPAAPCSATSHSLCVDRNQRRCGACVQAPAPCMGCSSLPFPPCQWECRLLSSSPRNPTWGEFTGPDPAHDNLTGTWSACPRCPLSHGTQHLPPQTPPLSSVSVGRRHHCFSWRPGWTQPPPLMLPRSGAAGQFWVRRKEGRWYLVPGSVTTCVKWSVFLAWPCFLGPYAFLSHWPLLVPSLRTCVLSCHSPGRTSTPQSLWPHRFLQRQCHFFSACGVPIAPQMWAGKEGRRKCRGVLGLKGAS